MTLHLAQEEIQQTSRHKLRLSLSDLIQEFGVSKRTVQRMLDTIKRNFPELEEVTHDDGVKRWRLPKHQKIHSKPKLNRFLQKQGPTNRVS